MKLLCIESSSDPTVLGIVDGEQVLAEEMLQNRDTLPEAVRVMLNQQKLTPSDLDAIVIGLGPGSFTGLRVGLAFAKGFARSAGLPVWPLPSLMLFAANVANEVVTVAAITPARRGQVHLQIFNGADLSEATKKQVVEYHTISGLLPENSALVGPAVAKLPAELQESLKKLLPQDETVHRAHVNIMANLAIARWSDRPAPESGELVPDYGLEFGT